MNRTIKEATVKRYHYDTHDQLRQHLGEFVATYNFGRRLKPSKASHLFAKHGSKEPKRFTSDLTHQIPGPNISRRRESAMESQRYGAFWDSNHSDKKSQGIDEGIAS
jgi:hypothetical protein